MMKRKFFAPIALGLAAVLSAGVLASCSSYTPSDKGYWFSKSEKSFVAYDEEKNNLSEAGTYWDFTSAYDGSVTMKLRMNVDLIFSTAYLYVNDVQVESDRDSWYTFSYALSLQKGDKLQLHAFWTNSLKTDETGFTIQVFVMNDGTGDYNVLDID
jgi:hypothetical protein